MEISIPWMVIGDFNSVISMEETMSTKKLDQRRCSDFINWISEQGLLDMGYTGPRFTLTRWAFAKTFQGARLDRALCNPEWRVRFPLARVEILPKMNSDHSLILIHLNSRHNWSPSQCFKFQAAWLTHPGFQNFVRTSWRTDLPFSENNMQIAGELTGWSRQHFGHIEKRKNRIWARVTGI